MKLNIRLLYLYLFSFVGLLITIIGSIQLVDLGIKTYLFQVTEYPFYPDPVGSKEQQEIYRQEFQQEQANQRKRQMSTAFSMIMVGAPVYFYHWRTIKKEDKT